MIEVDTIRLISVPSGRQVSVFQSKHLDRQRMIQMGYEIQGSPDFKAVLAALFIAILHFAAMIHEKCTG